MQIIALTLPFLHRSLAATATFIMGRREIYHVFLFLKNAFQKVTIPRKNGPLKIHLEVTILTNSSGLHFVQNELIENKKDLLLVSDSTWSECSFEGIENVMVILLGSYNASLKKNVCLILIKTSCICK